MNYRNFTRDNLKVYPLGFGTMRLPILNNDSSEIDVENAKKIIRYGIDNGINYIDTAYMYHQGNSEYLVGQALKDGYRERVYLATKSPSWLIKSHEDFHKFLDHQLEKLQTDYIDFYLLHTLNKDYWENLKANDVFKFIEEARESGKIKYIGFSFHDELDVFKEIVDSYRWDFCQIQLNYLDRSYQAGLEGLRYAKARDISLVIMEPIKGGKLVNPSDEIKDIWAEGTKRTPAEWALRWVLNMEEVGVVLSGMGNMEEVVENIKTASEGLPNSLKDEELEIINRVTRVYEDKIKVGCTACEYCLPCPQGVAIPDIFQTYNDYYVFGNQSACKTVYKKYMDRGVDASKCVDCGHCEELCPQHLPIRKNLKEADIVLNKD